MTTAKITICDMECEPCLGITPIDVQTKHLEGGTITHKKRITSDMTVGSLTIPLRRRSRDFHLDSKSGWERKYEGYAQGIQGDAYPCFEQKQTYFLSVSENATWTDGSVYIADTEHSNAFWREVVYKCVFSGSSTEVIQFFPPVDVYGCKLRINDVHYDVSVKWKLAINGNIEELYGEQYKLNVYTPDYPLFFVHPQPMGGKALDADFTPIGETYDGKPGKGYAFLDYRTYGQGPTYEEMTSGGVDYYYPEYLWYMGFNRAEDKDDALQRFYDNYGSVERVKDKEVRDMMRPEIYGVNDARGSITRDFAGNTFASVSVKKRDGSLIHFNRLQDKDGKNLTIPETLPGSDIRYYPIGVI